MRQAVLLWYGAVLMVLAGPHTGFAAKPAEAPVKATVCQLLADPKSWDRKLVEVSGFASHGFEDSGFSDPSCGSRWGGLWMEYGGKRRTGTMSTASSTARLSPSSTKMEGIKVPLVDDPIFHRFDDVLHQAPSVTVYATVVARFFAGEIRHYPKGDAWGGYGHMGCCSLFVVQQVIAVDDAQRADLDHNDAPDQPHADCFRILQFPGNPAPALKQQQQAEEGAQSFAFTDPDRVAKEEILRVGGITDASNIVLKKESASAVRAMYSARVQGSDTQYWVDVSRPYWLSHYSSNPAKIAWIVIASYAACSKDNEVPTVQRIR